MDESAPTYDGVEPSARFDGSLGVALFLLRAGPLLILVLLIIVIAIVTPLFLTTRNIGNVLAQTAVIAVLSLGQLLVIVTRGIDLSVGSTLALATVTGALVFHSGNSSLAVIAVMLGAGVVVGLVNGLLFVKGRIPHPFIVTLATFTLVRGVA
ncbi:MAG TPA: ABC transporter permease, partial [Acidimicrobiia bacterium]|nr:ABC transporter permease [Acidimicrobiia bacterium]